MDEKFIHEQLQLNFEVLADRYTAEANLLEELTMKIVWLLKNDLPALWNALYRIDVNEEKVKAVFGQNDPHLIAPGVAALVVNRLREKAHTRAQYVQKKQA